MSEMLRNRCEQRIDRLRLNTVRRNPIPPLVSEMFGAGYFAVLEEQTQIDT